MNNQSPVTITLDASQRPLGRLASEIAGYLQDKNLPSYSPERAGTTRVIVKNVTEIKVTGQKMTKKVFHWFTGHPGGLRSQLLRDAVAANPTHVLRDAVADMLPKNRLQKPRLARLFFE